MGGLLSLNALLNAIALVEQAVDRGNIADRWQIYAKAGGVYQKAPGSSSPEKMLTSADLSGYQTSDSDLTALAALNSTGFARQNGSGSWSIVSETGTGSVVRNTGPTIAGATLSGTLAAADQIVERPHFKDISEAIVAHGNVGNAETINLEDGNVHTGTLDDDCTFTFSNPPVSGRYGAFTLELTQDGTGGWTPTFPGTVIWGDGTPPTLPTGAGDTMRLFFDTMDGGTTWKGFLAGKNFA